MKDILVIDNLVCITIPDSDKAYEFWAELGRLNIPGQYSNVTGESLSIFAARHLPKVLEIAKDLNIELIDVRSSL